MARLRSMETGTASPATNSALDRIANAASKLNSTATPATTLDYPSLPKPEYPSLEKVLYPETPFITPKPDSRILAYATTTAKQLGNFLEEVNDGAPTTPSNPAQQLKVPSTGFEFRVIKTGEKKIEEFVPPAFPASVTPARPIAKRSRRFSDVHKRQFEKMESITTHYAAKRTPKQPVTIEKIPRGVKRTKSHVEFGDRGPPSSPSPIKTLIGGPWKAVCDGASPLKRTKISALTMETVTLPRKLSGIPRLAMTPTKGFKNRSATVEKISMGGRLNLMPATRHSLVQTCTTPSKIPSAIATPAIGCTDPTPSSAALPNRCIKPPSTDTPKKERNPLSPPKTDSFTFRSKGAGIDYKRLRGMHSLNYNPNKDTPTAPTPLLTPMRTSSGDPFVGIARRTAVEWAPAAAARGEKRKASHIGGHGGNDTGDGVAVDTIREGGARKRLKFASTEEPFAKATGAKETKEVTTAAAGTPLKKSLRDRGKAVLLRSRLNMLATPKRKIEMDAGGNGEKKDKDAGRIRWK
ncbi:hypothetical protein HOY82DRAFT_482205 [Tuber indicum]|nr:hypothetical protein HOY82DRAFT_482205 [Tuber indicum]